MIFTYFRRTAGGWLIGLVAAGLMLAACGTAPQPAVPLAPTIESAPNGAPAETGKLFVSAEGPVALTPADLAGIGWGGVDLTQIRVLQDQTEVPVWIDGGALRFYATLSPTRYMTESVYWLQRAPATRFIDSAPAATTGPAVESYLAVVHAEENHVYAPQPAEGDHWFWAQLPAPQTRTFTVTLDAVAPGPGSLAIETWAGTESRDIKPDHHYRVSINGHPLPDELWDGLGRHTIELPVPEGTLRDGDNVIVVDAPGVPGVAADTTYVDWIEVRQPRRFAAAGDRLIFDGVEGLVTPTGFSGNTEVFDITQPDRPVRLTGLAGASFAAQDDRRYAVVGPQGYQSGRLTAARTQPDLRAAVNGADYIAIGPDDLIAPLKPLLEYRRGQGLKPIAVPVDAIYDQFGDGRINPEAIHAFIRFASPRYVLLVGDASYDTLGYTTPMEANRLPTYMVQTVFGGETASDVGFAQLDADTKPDLAVGRVPARTADQVATFVDKTLKYEQAAPSGDWRRRVLAVADGQDNSFKTEATSFLNQFAAYSTVLINPPAGTPDANQQILAGLNEGSLLVSYFGHGSLTQWGKDNLFTVKDGAALTNGERLPMVLNFTCLTGLFTHPRVQSLAETLLWLPNGGAVAVVAPTSLTLATDQSFLSNALVKAFLANPAAPIGDLLLRAWREVPDESTGTQDVLRTFLLFGDPALVLAR